MVAPDTNLRRKRVGVSSDGGGRRVAEEKVGAVAGEEEAVEGRRRFVGEGLEDVRLHPIQKKQHNSKSRERKSLRVNLGVIAIFLLFKLAVFLRHGEDGIDARLLFLVALRNRQEHCKSKLMDE